MIFDFHSLFYLALCLLMYVLIKFKRYKLLVVAVVLFGLTTLWSPVKVVQPDTHTFENEKKAEALPDRVVPNVETLEEKQQKLLNTLKEGKTLED